MEDATEGRAAESVAPTATTILPTVLVSGTVVDDRGEPVEGATVAIFDDEGEVLEYRSRWLQGQAIGSPVRARSGSTGSFEVRGESQTPHLAASASKPGYFNSKKASFDCGATGVRLVITRGGVVTGRVVVDPGIPMDWLHVNLEGTVHDGDRPIGPLPLAQLYRGTARSEELSSTPSADGAFRFDTLASRTARITVTVENEESSVLAFDSIRVREIGEQPDPRLDPLDLRGALKLMTFDVLEDSGKKCSGATVVLSDPRARFRDRFQVTQDGRATLLVRAGPYDVDVERTGWRRVHLAGVLVGQVVQLQRGLGVRIVLDGTESLPDAPYRLVVALLVDVKPPRSDVDGIGTFSEGRETAFPVASPGVHEVGWYLESGTRQKRLTGTPRMTVDLRESSGEQVIHLQVPSALREVWEAEVERFEADRRRAEIEQEEALKRASERPRASSTAEPRPH